MDRNNPTITYDDMSRIQGITAGATAYQYSRDALGYVTSVVGVAKPDLPFGTTDTFHVPGSNRIDYSIGRQQAQYSHDSQGNIISDGTRTFTYNLNNRLAKVEMGEVLLGEYFYDSAGRRIKKVTPAATTYYIYDKDSNLIAEADGNGSLLREYIYLNGQIHAVATYGTPTGIYYYLNDQLGTPQFLVDENNNQVWSAAYLPFGEAIIDPNSTIEQNFRFPGQYYDSETGLHYNWHRYYDPGTGRYLRVDPIGFEGGDLNLYSYAKQNPINWTDPEGKEVKICYSPVDSILKYIRAKHSSIKAKCGIFGFHPKYGTIDWGPGDVRNDENRAGLNCNIKSTMTDCVDEECVCRKIKESDANPPNYSLFLYNCHSWTKQIISECQL